MVPHKTLNTLVFSPICAIFYVHDFITRIIFSEKYKSWSYSLATSSNFLSIRPSQDYVSSSVPSLQHSQTQYF